MKILFVCLGNICRSPMAAAILIHKKKQGLLDLSIDSCGTGNYHQGSPEDRRTRAALNRHGIEIDHRARQFNRADFSYSDLILTMDMSNFLHIQRLTQVDEEKKKVRLMRDWDSEGTGEDVPDPYTGNDEDFEGVYRILDRCCENLIGDVRRNEA